MRLWHPNCRDSIAALAPPVRALVEHGVDLAFPPHGDLPDRLLGRCCFATRAASVVDHQPACRHGAANVPSAMAENPFCPLCRKPAPPFQAAVRLGRLRGCAAIGNFADQALCRATAGRVLARLFVDERGAVLAGLELDVVVPIPMHWDWCFARGANNPDVLARRLAHGFGAKFRPASMRSWS